MTNYSELIEEIRAMREEGVPNLDGIEGKVIGICCTCKFQDTCAYLKSSTEPTYHCEEFETLKPKQIKVLQKSETKSDPQKPSTFKGLCVNCEKRESCTFPKPEGGIWHCEEYE